MKITIVRTQIVAASLPKPWRIGNYVMDKGYATLVEIGTDAGISGVGECLVRLGPGAARLLPAGGSLQRPGLWQAQRPARWHHAAEAPRSGHSRAGVR